MLILSTAMRWDVIFADSICSGVYLVFSCTKMFSVASFASNFFVFMWLYNERYCKFLLSHIRSSFLNLFIKIIFMAKFCVFQTHFSFL